MIPETSTTLLRNVRDAEHPRWPEFVAKYRPMMEAYLKARFPTLEADDIIQETFAALCAILPGYIYDPDEKGHFRNYLTGILRNKARRALRRERRDAEFLADVRHTEVSAPYHSESGRAGSPLPAADDEQSWRETLVEIALQQLMNDKSLREKIDIARYVSADCGLPTLQDILKELDKPGLDPRAKFEIFEFDKNVTRIEDVKEGMELPGIVTNITAFGAFVDIGVHQDGLVHISQLANRRVNDPSEVVHLHQHVRVRVLEVDLRRHRISLSMKGF